MHHSSQSHVSSLHRVLHITHTYICVYIYIEIYICKGLGPLYPGTIHGSALFIRRDDIWVWALYTQGCWPGIKYIYGSGPFIPRDAGRGLSTYSGLCPDTQGFGQGLYIYIHITQNIYMCVCTCCV